jgi:RNA polymerase-binding transcription factor DksA
MAKTKKTSAKPAKKAPKAKPAASVKKAAPSKSAKKAPAKKVVAKKAAPKKAAPKKAAPKKVAEAKKAPAPKKEVKKEEPKKIATAPAPKAAAPKKAPKAEKAEKSTARNESAPVEKPVASAPKVAPPQLNIFPVLNQRPIAHKPAQSAAVQDNRTRYSEEELKEFELLINKKLDKAKEEYKILKDTLNRNNDEGTDATSGGNTKVLEDGAETAEKENLSQLAARQQKYITNLENALVRIKNGTYGICSVTGKLISKERLIAVPHTTQSIEAKMMQHD